MKAIKNTKVKFHVFDLDFKPYKDDSEHSSSYDIMKSCIRHIQDLRSSGGNTILIDRNEGQKNTDSRNIFMLSSSYKVTDGKIKCRLALIRENRLPKVINKQDYSLLSFKDLGDHAIIETTDFYIDYSTDTPIICCEYNYYGPRISDIEYYFRKISHDILGISTKCKASLHMKQPIGEVLNSIADVLKFNMKVVPDRLKYISEDVDHAFVSNMRGLSDSIKPKYVRVEAFFRDSNTGKTIKPPKNTQALSLVKKLLSSFQNEDTIEDFEEFKLRFEKDDGTDDTFNLLTGKEEIVVECKLDDSGNLVMRELYEKAVVDFKQYLIEKAIVT